MKKLLIGTEEKYLLYNTTDAVWGAGADLAGKNLLGKLLMEVRDKINLQENEK